MNELDGRPHTAWWVRGETHRAAARFSTSLMSSRASKARVETRRPAARPSTRPRPATGSGRGGVPTTTRIPRSPSCRAGPRRPVSKHAGQRPILRHDRVPRPAQDEEEFRPRRRPSISLMSSRAWKARVETRRPAARPSTRPRPAAVSGRGGVPTKTRIPRSPSCRAGPGRPVSRHAGRRPVHRHDRVPRPAQDEEGFCGGITPRRRAPIAERPSFRGRACRADHRRGR